MAGRPRRRFSISESDRLKLEALRDRAPAASPLWARASIILAYGEFRTNALLAEHLGVAESLVSKCVTLFRRGGITALYPKAPPGRSTSATEKQVEQVLALRRSRTNRRKKPPTYAQIGKCVGLHPSTVVRIIVRAEHHRAKKKREWRSQR